MKRAAYSVIVLRYVHDLVGEEFVNVGLLLISAEHRFAKFAVLPRTKRVLQFFPGTKAVSIRSALKAASENARRAFDLVGGVDKVLANAGDLRTRISEIADQIAVVDDSALQWSEISVGVTADPKEAFSRLFDRLILKYEEGASSAKKTDAQVWKEFSRVIEKRNFASQIQEHVIISKLDKVTFKHALKNGKWHLLEPVSFDLANAESVTDKAKRLLGEMTLLRESDTDFRLYFLVGSPSSDDVQDAYQRALRILEEIPCEKLIFQEHQAEQLATELARAVH